MVTVRNVALVFGIVYLLVGILGFILVPGGMGNLLGIFAVDTVHNVVHLLLGILGIGAAYTGMARLYCQVVGAVLILLAVLGFVLAGADGMLLGILHLNLADHLLHLVTGGILAYFGFMAQRDGIAATR
jgi:hypothetical protein